MNNRLITSVIIALVAVVTSVTGFAQTRIDNIVAELEKQNDVQVTYTERRNPKTKKLVKQSIILNGNSKAQAEKLWNAFERERTNSVSVTKSRNTSFVIKFENSQGVSSYVLSISGNSWSLVITKRGPDVSDDDSYSYEFNCSDLSGLDALSSLDQLDCLNSLDALDALDCLNDPDLDSFDGDMTVYGSNGTVVIRKSDKETSKSSGKSASKSASKSSSKAKSKSSSRSRSHGRTIKISNGSTALTYSM